MKAINRNLKKVYFHSMGDTPYIHSIVPPWKAETELERVTWNSDQDTQSLKHPARAGRRQPLEVWLV